MVSKLVKEVAQAMACRDGYDPNEFWEDFDRNAAATVSTSGEYDGWEDDVFPRTYRWEEYESKAETAVSMIIEQAAKVAFNKSTHPFDIASSIGNAILELKLQKIT